MMRRALVFARGLSGVAGRQGGKNRAVAEKVAARRRAKEEALVGDENRSGSLPALLATSAILGLGGYFALTERGSAQWNEYVYRGTPLGKFVDMMRERIGMSVKSFTDPLSEELLPDFPMETLPPGMKQPMTLVLDFEDTLCHLEWDRKNGWRASKRPGVDVFLNRLAPYYEMVLFSNGQRMFLEPFAFSLDQLGIIQHKLFRESTVYEEGEHVKDLRPLNRDLKRVITISFKEDSFKKHPENGIVVEPFTDPTKPDPTLIDLIPFLEDLAMSEPEDVRPILNRYQGNDVGKIFKQELQEQRQREQEKRKGTLGDAIRKGGLFGGAALRKASGGERSPAESAPPQPQAPAVMYDIPMTPIDQADSLPKGPPLDPKNLKKLKEEEEKSHKKEGGPPSGTIWSSLGLGK